MYTYIEGIRLNEERSIDLDFNTHPAGYLKVRTVLRNLMQVKAHSSGSPTRFKVADRSLDLDPSGSGGVSLRGWGGVSRIRMN